MAIIRPNRYHDISESEINENAPVSEETIRKLIYNVNMLRALCPVAEVMPIQVNIPGVPLPATSVWQFANGGEITEPNSPLNGAGPQQVIDMTNVYPRGATNSGAAGGAPTVNLEHSHGTDSPGFPGNSLEAGDEQRAFEPVHNHGINNDLSAAEPLDPAHMKCAFFMKIS